MPIRAMEASRDAGWSRPAPHPQRSQFARQHRDNLLLYLVSCEGFANIAPRAVRKGLDYMRFAAFGRDHNHRHIFRILNARKAFDKLQSVHYRHVDVAKNDVNLTFLKDGQRFRPVPGFDYLAKLDAGLPQRALHNLTHDGGIVHNEGAYAVHDR